MRGHGADERIVHGAGRVPTADLGKAVAQMLADPHVAWVDLRSAKNTCWQARATRAL